MMKSLLLILLTLSFASCVEEIPVDQLEQETFNDSGATKNPIPEAADKTGPVFISSSPSGTQPESTTAINLNIVVNEPSECRYDFTNKSFLNMSYSLTSNDKINHFKQISPVTNDQTYTYQVRCRDLSISKNESVVREIKFYVDKKGAMDIIAPNIESISPSGFQNAGKTSVELKAILNEKGICKYSEDNSKAFDTMDSFNTTDGTIHTKNLLNLIADKQYTYYVICKDIAGNPSIKKQTTFLIEKEVTIDLNIAAKTILDRSCLKCHGGSIGTFGGLDLNNDSTLYSASTSFIVKGEPNSSKVYLSLLGSSGVKKMPTDAGTLIESERFIIRDWIASMQKPVDNTDPVLLMLLPNGVQPSTEKTVLLSASTMESTDCRYNETNISFKDMTKTLSPSSDKQTHSKTIGVVEDSIHHYYVYCKDDAGNINKTAGEIKFTIAKGADTIKPVIQPIAAIIDQEAGTKTLPIEIKTNEKANCGYSTNSNANFGSMNAFTSNDKLTHNMTANSLVDNATFTYYFICQDLAGNPSDKKQISFKVKAPVQVDLKVAAKAILDQNCLGCHNSSLTRAGLDLSKESVVYDKIEKFIVKGVPEQSRIYLSLTKSGGVSQMPPSGALPEKDRFIIRDWILSMPKDVTEPEAIICKEEEDLSSALTRMLLDEEIGRSFDVLLGDSKFMPDLTELPGKIGNKFGIIKDGSLQSVSKRDVGVIYDSLEKSIDKFISEKGFSTNRVAAGANHTIFSCEGLQSTALNQCLDREIVPILYRSWRRPITSAQKQDLYNNFSGKSFTEGLKLALLSTFLDPKFLFISYDDNTIPRKLNSFEIAERLSFLIWGRVPPINLLDYAASNNLTDKTKLKVAINLLFDFEDGNNPDDLRRNYAWAFYHDLQNQWLDIKHIEDKVVPSGVSFPAGEIQWATMFYIEEMFRKNKTIKEMFDSNFVVVTKAIDHLYGVDFNQAKEAEYDIYHVPSKGYLDGNFFRKMVMPADKRKGLFTQVGVLAANAGRKEEVSSTERGLWHAQNILCDTPEGLPSNVPLDDAIISNPNLSLKEKFAEHAKSPACAGCHKIMDPIGFGLFGYDVFGREREKDNSGFDIDPSGILEDQFFSTTDQMVDIISQSKKAEICTMSHLTTFSVGRAVDAKVSCTAQKILNDTKAKGGGLRDILEETIMSDLFLMRRR